jgi:hypothetical protein
MIDKLGNDELCDFVSDALDVDGLFSMRADRSSRRKMSSQITETSWLL